MSLFKSSKEKRLWFLALMVVLAIYSTLFLGKPFLSLLRNQDIQAVIFLIGMMLVGGSILFHSIKTSSVKTELAIWLGMIAVYLMLFLRLGISERSHLIEYSVLAIFIHKALAERFKSNQILKTGLVALVITILIGTLDETLQLFLPDRVFDPVDILFNSLAAVIAIGSNLIFIWIKNRKQKV